MKRSTIQRALLTWALLPLYCDGPAVAQSSNRSGAVYAPERNLIPASLEDCDAISRRNSEQADRLNTAHQQCLDNAEKAHIRTQAASSPEICSQGGCQQLHTLMREAASYNKLANQYAGECRDIWNKKEQQRRKEEAETKRRAEQQESERQQQESDAARANRDRDRQMQQAQRQQDERRAEDDSARRRAAQQQTAEEARRKAAADAVAKQFATEQSAQEQRALAQRTAEREQQLTAMQQVAQRAAAEAAARSEQAARQIAEMDNRLLASNSNPFGTASDTVPQGTEFDFKPAGTANESLQAKVSSMLSTFLSETAVSQLKTGLGEWVSEHAGTTGRDLLEQGQSAYEHYTEVKEAASIWQRIAGDDRRDSITAIGEGAGMYADHAFSNPVQNWLVKKNTQFITATYNNAFDVLDGAFTQFDGGTVNAATATMMDDPALMLPGVETLLSWNATLNTSYEKFKKLFTPSAY